MMAQIKTWIKAVLCRACALQATSITLLLAAAAGGCVNPPPSRSLEATMSVHEAARCGYINQVRVCLLDGEDVNARDAAGATPLHMAAMGGWLETTQLLLDQGALPDARDKLTGGTPLIMAVMHGHTDVLELLLAEGADIDMSTNRGTTALHAAVAVGRRDIVRRLLDHGADVTLRDEKGRTATGWSKQFDRNDLYELLIGAGAPVTEE